MSSGTDAHRFKVSTHVAYAKNICYTIWLKWLLQILQQGPNSKSIEFENVSGNILFKCLVAETYCLKLF